MPKLFTHKLRTHEIIKRKYSFQLLKAIIEGYINMIKDQFLKRGYEKTVVENQVKKVKK